MSVSLIVRCYYFLQFFFVSLSLQLLFLVYSGFVEIVCMLHEWNHKCAAYNLWGAMPLMQWQKCARANKNSKIVAQQRTSTGSERAQKLHTANYFKEIELGWVFPRVCIFAKLKNVVFWSNIALWAGLELFRYSYYRRQLSKYQLKLLLSCSHYANR